MFEPKLFFLLLALLLGIVWVINFIANIFSPYKLIKKQIDQQFEEMNDDEKILPMPLGGYLQGYAKVGELVNGRFDEVTLKKVDSKTDSNSITVAEAKEKELVRYRAMQNGKKSGQADRDRPAPRMSVIVLPNGQKYLSDYFSDSHNNQWTFGSYWFLGEINSESYGSVNWKVHNGSGRVGTIAQANNTYYGIIEDGTLISSSNSWAPIGNGKLLTYCSNVPNSFFEVMGPEVYTHDLTKEGILKS